MKIVFSLLLCGYIGTASANCVPTIRTLGVDNPERTEGGWNVQLVRARIRSLLSIDTANPVERWVVVSDEGLSEQADSKPRGMFERGADSYNLSYELIETRENTSLYFLSGPANSIGSLLEKLPLRTGSRTSGLVYLGSENPNSLFSADQFTSSDWVIIPSTIDPRLFINRILRASVAERATRAISYSPNRVWTKKKLADESSRRLAKLLKRGAGFRYRTTIGIDAVFAILNSEAFKSQIRANSGEEGLEIIKLLEAYHKAGFIRQMVARSGSGREGESVDYYFEIFAEWTAGNRMQGRVIKLYYSFGD